MAVRKYRVDVYDISTGESSMVIALNSKTVLSALQVGSLLGISPRTFRRWLNERRFPPSFIHSVNRKQDFWFKMDVVKWQKYQILNGQNPKTKAKYSSIDATDRENAKRFSLLPIDVQNTIRRQIKMQEMLHKDPSGFKQRHPNLRPWLKNRGDLIKILDKYDFYEI